MNGGYRHVFQVFVNTEKKEGDSFRNKSSRTEILKIKKERNDC